MAKVDFSHLARFISFLEKNRDPSKRIFQCIHLDFANERALMQTPRWAANISLPLAPGNAVKVPENFSVFVEDLSRLIRVFPILDVVDNGFQSESGDVLNIQFFPDEDYEFPSLIEGTGASDLAIDDDIRNSLADAAMFMSPDPTSSFNGLFLREDRLVGVDGLQWFFEEKFSGNFNVNLPWMLVQFLITQRSGEIKLSWTEENQYLVSIDNVFQLQTVSNTRLDVPDTKVPEFTVNYDHPDSFVFNREGMLEILKFLEPFVKTVANQRVQLEFLPTGVKVKALDGVRIERFLAAEFTTPGLYDGVMTYVSARVVMQILGLFKTETVRFQFDPNAAPINVTATGDGEWTRHIFFVQYKKDGGSGS